jgi:hypothetical protein
LKRRILHKPSMASVAYPAKVEERYQANGLIQTVQLLSAVTEGGWPMSEIPSLSKCGERFGPGIIRTAENRSRRQWKEMSSPVTPVLALSRSFHSEDSRIPYCR